MINKFQLRKINSSIRLSEISKFKYQQLEVGDKWFTNNEGVVVKQRCLLKEYHNMHKHKKVVNFIFDILNDNKHWNQSRVEVVS